MGCTVPNIDVTCDNWSATTGASFTWHNNISATAVISRDGNNPWPFGSNFGSGSSIPAGQNSNWQLAMLSAGGHSYQVNGAVKHVVISAPEPKKRK